MALAYAISLRNRVYTVANERICALILPQTSPKFNKNKMLFLADLIIIYYIYRYYVVTPNKME